MQQAIIVAKSAFATGDVPVGAIVINKDGVEVGRAAGTPKREQVLAALAAIH